MPDFPSRSRLRPALAVIALLTGAGLAACSSGSKPASSNASGPTTTAPAATTLPAGTSPSTAAIPGPSATLRIATAPWVLPQPRAREIVLGAEGALLVIGGLDAGGSSTARVWRVALPSGTTTRLAVLPQTLHDSAGAILGSDVYVFGGGSATELATVQRYRAGAGSVVGQMPQARSDLVAVGIDGTAYVLGGFDGTRSIASVLATTDGASFRTVAQLPETVRYPAVATMGGRIWLFGGTHDGAEVSTIQRIDPATGGTAIVGQLPAPLADASAVVVGGRILIVGGRSRGRILDTVLQFDPATGRTTAVGRLPYPVADAGAAEVDGIGYVVGGETPGKVASAVTLGYR